MVTVSVGGLWRANSCAWPSYIFTAYSRPMSCGYRHLSDVTTTETYAVLWIVDGCNDNEGKRLKDARRRLFVQSWPNAI